MNTDPKNIGHYQVSTTDLGTSIYVTIIDTTTGKVEEMFSVPWKKIEVRKPKAMKRHKAPVE